MGRWMRTIGFPQDTRKGKDMLDYSEDAEDWEEPLCVREARERVRAKLHRVKMGTYNPDLDGDIRGILEEILEVLE